MTKNFSSRVTRLNMQDIEVATSEAKCSNCDNIFDHPSLGSSAYGQIILCSENGKVFAYCDLMTPVGKLLDILLPEKRETNLLQKAHAEFADPILGQKLKLELHCPKCFSSKMEYWEGQKTGSIGVKPASYNNFLSLERKELLNKIASFIKSYTLDK